MTPAEKNLAAEVRAVEDGHRAFLAVDAHGKAYIKVVSDTHADKGYRVNVGLVSGARERLRFYCEPEGRMAFKDDHRAVSADAGVTPCKHAALAARRMEREGLAKLDGGHWVATDKAEKIEPMSKAEFEDMFGGL